MLYNPGLHIIATIDCTSKLSLEKFQPLKLLLDNLISDQGLQKLGDVYHNFSPAGYTGIVCLSESHISVHTWPEYSKVNLDIYLSNFQHENDNKGHLIYQALQKYFAGATSNEQIIRR